VDFNRMTGVDKAAVLALSLPSEQARALLSRLGDDELERVLEAVARLDEVPEGVQEKVLAEFHASLEQRGEVRVGGRARAAALAHGVLDPERADRLSQHLGRDETRIDRVLARFEPGFVARVLAVEHPQTIALVLSQVSTARGAQLIGKLPEALGADVVLRLANLDAVPAEVIAELEQGVGELFARWTGPAARVGGMKAAAELLNRVPRLASSAILAGVDARNPVMATEIRRRMFNFEDLRFLDAKGFQALLREIAIEEIVVALRGASDELREKVFENVSARAAEQIREDLELLGPVRRSEVERVQTSILDLARGLEDVGRIQLGIGEDDDELV
jgi:flagellar motor switch protein FliG